MTSPFVRPWRGTSRALLATEVLYPNGTVEAQGEPLTGEHRYTLQFAAEQIPPVATFWNLNVFDQDMFFVENDLGRYSIGSTTQGLITAEDGSITLFIQQEQPEGEDAAKPFAHVVSKESTLSDTFPNQSVD